MCGFLSGKQGLAVDTFFDVRGEEGSDSCTIQDSCIGAAEKFHRRWKTAHRRVCIGGEGEVVSCFKEDL